MALPIWGKFTKAVYEDKDLALPKVAFQRPPSLAVELDCKRYRKLHPMDTTQTNPQGFNFED